MGPVEEDYGRHAGEWTGKAMCGLQCFRPLIFLCSPVRTLEAAMLVSCAGPGSHILTMSDGTH